MITLAQILNSTPPDWQARAKDLGSVSFLTNKLSFYGSKKIPYLRNYFMVKGLTDNYIQEIVFPFTIDLIKKPSYLIKTPVKVYCECAAFKYYSAYAIKSKKGTVYKKNLGQAWTDKPVVRNPDMKPMCCKHLVKVIKVLSTKSIVLLMRKTQNQTIPSNLKRKIRSLKEFTWDQ